jgi:hypothetical protein
MHPPICGVFTYIIAGKPEKGNGKTEKGGVYT